MKRAYRSTISDRFHQVFHTLGMRHDKSLMPERLTDDFSHTSHHTRIISLDGS